MVKHHRAKRNRANQALKKEEKKENEQQWQETIQEQQQQNGEELTVCSLQLPHVINSLNVLYH